MDQRILRSWSSVAILSLLAVTGCHVNFNGLDGYSFDYQGQTAERTVEGPIQSEVRSLEVDHRFGDVVVKATDGPTRWTWELKCWATEQAVADAYLDVIYLQVQAIEEEHGWKLLMPDSADELRGVRSKLTIEAPADVEVKIANRHGSSAVSGVARSVQVENRHGNVELADLADQCDVSNSHGQVKAERIASAKLSNEHGNITVEGARDLEIRGSHGAVRLRDIAQHCEVNASHSGIDVDDIRGGATLKTRHAAIRVENATGELELSNQHGHIDVNGAVGKILAKTLHGNIKLDVASRNVACDAQHSNITLKLSNPDLQSVEAKTTHGNIEVAAPAGASVQIDAHADHGRMLSDLPSVSDGARFVLRTSHGNINIRETNP